MAGILQNLKSLGAVRLSIIGGVVAVVMGVLLFGLSQVTKPVFSPLYSGLSPTEASEIVRTLEGASIPVEVSTDSAVVSVPRENFARARMALAENGLPSEGAPGWELFDEGSGLGMNTFMQKVNRLRALEGELGRSIQTIKGVDSARVHLVMPEREAFSRERTEPSASVVIRSGSAYSMEDEQAVSIQHLVASAVANLSPGKVTVLSADGGIIISEGGEGSSAEATLGSIAASKEQRYAEAIRKLLSARVGAGNARVQVSVDIDTEREVVVSETYDPDQQVVRSSETTEDIEESNEQNPGNVSVENNLPENLAQDDGGAGGSSSTSQSTSEVLNYEIGNTRSETIKEPGDVERVSVAVLVNGIYNRQDNGEVEYQQRDPEEMERLTNLVKSAIGFDEGRGDTVSVDSLRFMDYSMEVGDPITPSVLDILKENIMTIIKWIFVLLIVALVMLVGVRPVVQRVIPAPVSADDDEESDDALDDDESEAGEADQPQGARGATGGGSAASAFPTDGSGEVSPELQHAHEAARKDDEMINIMSVKGGVRQKRIERVGELAEQREDDTVRLIRGWLRSEKKS